MGIFSKVQDYVGQQKSNVFDLSFVNNLTLPIGALVPCCVKEVVNGDKFRIRGRFGFNFLPTYFPIQSTLKVDCQFFYVRNRNLWDRWTDFQFNPDISTDSDLTPPYYSSPSAIRDACVPGSLGDYMGLPTTFPSSFFSSIRYNYTTLPSTQYSIHQYWMPEAGSSTDFNYIFRSGSRPVGSGSFVDKFGVLYCFTNWPNNNAVFMPSVTLAYSKLKLTVTPSGSSSTVASYTLYYYEDGVLKSYSFSNSPSTPVTLTVDNTYTSGLNASNSGISGNVSAPRMSFLLFSSPTSSGLTTLPFTVLASTSEDYVSSTSLPSAHLVNPIVNSSTGAHISCLPFRAYESIYNAYYRDERVNPLTDSEGKIIYNKWLLNTSGGSQSTALPPLYYRNWELDPYTSSQLSPQQGVAPLVGVTSLGDMQFASSDGQTYTVRPNLADDGTTVVNAELTSDIPSDVRRSFINLATSGISINDFRNVNSFQRWLETNMRRGFKYRDQIIAHTGVRPRFDVLDMPEFIGGFSTIVNSQKVNQTSESTAENPLGSYAGQMSAFGNSSHDINVTCDENGFIIGIVCVYPVPVYDSLLQPFFSYSQPLDYYNQEFSHIGMQPIYNYMVAPSLATGSSVSELWTSNSKVFGYQRAWWQYLSSTDEVHGEFRTSFKDFLFRRDFANQPSLSPSFTVINPDEITNPFSVRTTDHKVLGQIAFDIKAIRPIPKFGIPRIE